MEKKKHICRKVSASEKAIIVKRKLEGATAKKVGEELGRSAYSINAITRNNKMRALIEKEASRIINKGLGEAGDLIVGLVEDGRKKGADKDDKRLGFDAAKHITNIAGISGGAPGTVINTLIQVNQRDRVAELSNVQKFLTHQWGVKDEPEVVDAEVEEVKE